ncbi:efflux RND transporter periplasmic adaptor subunit [Gallaecimonas sp. GXIMD4217]|uniref:efflux RND transporter periplasmic adaptor subunit n=1 Tax=Gallaecimonas sp. GXIMD4217 TaxID=3131927 RepID=UPI00311B37DB
MRNLVFCLALLSVPAWAEQPPSPVQLGESRLSHDVPTQDVVGTVYSVDNAEITAGVEGRLDWVATPGTLVEAGAVIARIDDAPLRLQRAELAAQLRRAKVQAGFELREYQRLRDLQQTQSISAVQLDQADARQQLAQADAEIIAARLAQLDDRLARTQVRSPVAGVVSRRLREAGFDVSRSTPLVQVQNIHQLEVRAFVPVQYLHHVRAGEALAISGTRLSDQARVKAVIPAADPGSQTAELRLALAPDQQSWIAGEHVSVKVPIRAATAAVTVPRDAVLIRSDGTYVVTVDKDNIAHRKAVTLGQGQGEWVTVEQGLEAGEKVVTRGAERLQEGQPVSTG